MAKSAHNKAVIVQTPDNIGSQQSNFVRSNFDDFITDKGYECYIERAMRCPCIVRGTGQALSSCMNCGGTGWFFIDKQQSIIACTSISNKSKYIEWTEHNMGTISITARPQDRLAHMDRVTLTELEAIFQQTFQLKLNTAGTALFGFLTYKPIVIFDVYLFQGDDEPLKYLEPNVDYTFSDSKINLSFALYGAMLNPTITVRYVHNPSYHILDINRDLIKQRQGGLKPCTDTLSGEKTNLPIHCIGRKAQFVLDTPDYNGESLFDNTNYDRAPIKYDY